MNVVPRVSVVMTAWNREQYVDAAIVSVLRQTFTDFEFIIVDDGSTDGTATIIRRHAESDPRIRVITQTNQGIASAANAGCKVAQGEFIARFDSDDICVPDRLMRQVKFLDNNPNYAVVSGAGQILADSGLTGHVLRLGPTLSPLSHVLDSKCCIIQPAVMMRRTVFETCGPYRQCVAPAEDYDLWLRIADCFELVNLDEPPLIHYRMHAGQASSSQLRRQVLGSLASQAATQIRRSTGYDPLVDVDELTPAVFKRMGITEEVAEAKVIQCSLERLLPSIRTASSNECDETQKYLKSIRRSSVWPQQPSVRRLVAVVENELAVQRIRLLVKAGSVPRAIVTAVKTAVFRPSLIVRVVRRLLRKRTAM